MNTADQLIVLMIQALRQEMRAQRRLLWAILGREVRELEELEEIEEKIGKEGHGRALLIVRPIAVVSRDSPASWRTDNDMAFQLRDGEAVILAIDPRDLDGNAAKIDGDPVWTSSDPTLITVTPNPADAKQVKASTVPGAPLSATPVTIAVSADADLGAGVKTITGSLDIDKVAGDATVVNIVPGVPTPR